MKTLFSKHLVRHPRGFTLIEMLTVIGIIALLVALVTPALIDVVRATRLNSAGDGLVNRLSLAQQSAVSLATDVEVRFYRYVNEDEDASGTPHYYAYQVVQLPVVGESVKPKALSDPYYIESGVILSGLDELSPLLQTSIPQVEVAPNQYLFTPTVRGLEPTDVEYAAIKFFADGSCKALTDGGGDLEVEQAVRAYTIPNLQESFVTFVEARNSTNPLPTNFYCVQIDSYTGKTRTYRP